MEGIGSANGKEMRRKVKRRIAEHGCGCLLRRMQFRRGRDKTGTEQASEASGSHPTRSRNDWCLEWKGETDPGHGCQLLRGCTTEIPAEARLAPLVIDHRPPAVATLVCPLPRGCGGLCRVLHHAAGSCFRSPARPPSLRDALVNPTPAGVVELPRGCRPCSALRTTQYPESHEVSLD